MAEERRALRRRPRSAPDEGQARQNRPQGQQLAREELGDGQSDDVARPSEVGEQAVGLGGAQAAGDEAEAERDLARVDGVDVEVDGESAGPGGAEPVQERGGVPPQVLGAEGGDAPLGDVGVGVGDPVVQPGQGDAGRVDDAWQAGEDLRVSLS